MAGLAALCFSGGHLHCSSSGTLAMTLCDEHDKVASVALTKLRADTPVGCSRSRLDVLPASPPGRLSASLVLAAGWHAHCVNDEERWRTCRWAGLDEWRAVSASKELQVANDADPVVEVTGQRAAWLGLMRT